MMHISLCKNLLLQVRERVQVAVNDVQCARRRADFSPSSAYVTYLPFLGVKC